jgi:bloom syndrome protein
VSKYGDRLLETIEKTINEYYHTDKNSSGSKGSTDSAKRRREANRDPDSNAEGDDDDDSLIKSTGRSKKRTVRRQIKKAEIYDSEEEDYYHGCLDEDLDCINIEDEALDKVTGTDAAGRVLPQWTAS